MVERRYFRTLRGVLSGEESGEENVFKYSATLRIHGNGIPFDEISQRLGVEPTHLHKIGEKRGNHSPSYRDDAWHYSPSIDELRPLEEHIEALWAVVRPHVAYIKSLKAQHKVDIFCGYRSNCDTAGIEVPHTCLTIFTELEVPFGLSIIVA